MGPPKIRNQIYPKKYECDRCDYVSGSKAGLGRHMSWHGDTRSFVCSFPGCNFRSKCPRNLNDHKIRHDPLLSTRYKCPMCEKGFPSSYEMDRHVRNHVKEKLHECLQCDFKSVTKSGIRSHVKRRHEIGKKAATRTTTLETEDVEGLVIPHEVGKDECGSKVYKCLFPGCSYKTKFGNMAKHKTVHKPRNAKTLIKCTAVDCTYETKWICHYRKHLKLHDPNRKRNSVCPLCPKRFWDASGLKRHARTHTGEKVYKCQHCDYASVVSSNICSHRKKYHSEFLLKSSGSNKINSLTITGSRRPQFKINPMFQHNAKNTPIVILDRIVIFE